MSTAAVPGSRTAAALAARRHRTEAALGRVQDALARLRREKAQISVAAGARRADVSRTFLYDNPNARAAVAAAMTEAGERRTHTLADRDDQQEATWRERALNSEDALKAARAEIVAHRRTPRPGPRPRSRVDRGGHPAHHHRNTTLKQRVRLLTTDNRTLDERLKAARSNLRFQDRRLADLEAQLTGPSAST